MAGEQAAWRKRGVSRNMAFGSPTSEGAVTVAAWVYILRCADGSYYVGSARGTLEHRIAEHKAGIYGGYTAERRPVRLVFAQEFDRITDAVAAERQIKGWSRAKKDALIAGDMARLKALSRRRQPHPSRRGSANRSSG